MSYIIYAEFFKPYDHRDDVPMDWKDRLKGCRILSEGSEIISVDIPGKFGEEQERTRRLCNALIDAGITTFKIGHSY